MKQIKLVAIAVLIFTSFIGCNSNSGKSSQTSSSNATDAAMAPQNQDAGTFSCMINGKEVSGKDPLKNQGIILAGDSGKDLSFNLQDDIPSKNWPCTHSFTFGMPAKEGKATDDADNCGGKLSTWGPDGFVYPSHGIVVNITKLNNSRVAGTFSGKFMPENITRSDTMYVTDGKFDIPVRTQ